MKYTVYTLLNGAQCTLLGRAASGQYLFVAERPVFCMFSGGGPYQSHEGYLPIHDLRLRVDNGDDVADVPIFPTTPLWRAIAEMKPGEMLENIQIQAAIAAFASVVCRPIEIVPRTGTSGFVCGPQEGPYSESDIVYC